MRRQHEIIVEGVIDERSKIFDLTIEENTDIIIDLMKMICINSIGIKMWMEWVYKLPKSVVLHLSNCPFLIINQSVTVKGFISENSYLESFFVPYYCNSCGSEKYHLLSRGTDYEYKTPSKEAKATFPDKFKCFKCPKGQLEPDFIVDKTFLFLGLREQETRI